jgi:hypothetical protein
MKVRHSGTDTARVVDSAAGTLDQQEASHPCRRLQRRLLLSLQFSAWQVLIFKIVINILTWVLLIDFYITMSPHPSASRSSNNWKKAWPIMLPFLNVGLFASQLYSIYIIYGIARRHDRRAAFQTPKSSGFSEEGSPRKVTYRPSSEEGLKKEVVSELVRSLSLQRQSSYRRAATFARQASDKIVQELHTMVEQDLEIL